LPKKASRISKKPDEKFKRFINDLIDNQDHEIDTMKQWIDEIIK